MRLLQPKPRPVRPSPLMSRLVPRNNLHAQLALDDIARHLRDKAGLAAQLLDHTSGDQRAGQHGGVRDR